MVTQVHQWSFKNNGIVFRDEDWSRLKKIGPSILTLLRTGLNSCHAQRRAILTKKRLVPSV